MSSLDLQPAKAQHPADRTHTLTLAAMTTESTNWEIPTRRKAWEAMRKRFACENVDIHSLGDPDSASKIQVEQFLTLKVLWPRRSQSQISAFLKGIGFDTYSFSKETESMERRSAWNLYLDALQKNANAGQEKRPRPYTLNSVFPDEMGPFALVLYNQLEIVDLPKDGAHEDLSKVEFTPSRAPRKRRQGHGVSNAPPEPHTPQDEFSRGAIEISSPAYEGGVKVPDAKDEQIVNLALINFLSAVWINDERNSEWSLKRKEFKFESKGNGAGFLARTDGHLRVTSRLGLPDRSGAILEVKARRRPNSTDKDHRIEMQESAQMALWIYQEPHSHWTVSTPSTLGSAKGKEIAKKDKFYRILLSQDKDQIFFTVAEYTEEYVDYLHKRNNITMDSDSHLSMYMFGPYDTWKSEHMGKVAPLIKMVLTHAVKSVRETPPSVDEELAEPMQTLDLDPQPPPSEHDGNGPSRKQVSHGEGKMPQEGEAKIPNRQLVQKDSPDQDPFASSSRMQSSTSPDRSDRRAGPPPLQSSEASRSEHPRPPPRRPVASHDDDDENVSPSRVSSQRAPGRQITARPPTPTPTRHGDRVAVPTSNLPVEPRDESQVQAQAQAQAQSRQGRPDPAQPALPSGLTQAMERHAGTTKQDET